MALQRYDPPGMLEDFDDRQRDAWHRYISGRVDASIAGNPAGTVNDAPRARFFNLTRTELADDETTKEITWTAFPRNLTINSINDRQRWQQADSSRDLQDEYCEWSVEREPASNKISRVTFTCEGPEYWEALANSTPDVALALYREFVDTNVQMADLLSVATGRYNPRNRWNRSTKGGAMHLIQVNNSLGAEIELAAAASNPRLKNGVLLTDARELILCGRYGDSERHSDPHIGSEVNALARAQADITVANPVGIYFADLSTAGWQTPDDSDPKDYWSYVRGIEGRAVRAVFEVPANKGFSAGDILIDGRTIDFGGQIADRITMKIVGQATRIGQSMHPPMQGCVEVVRAQPEAAALEAVAVAPLDFDAIIETPVKSRI